MKRFIEVTDDEYGRKLLLNIDYIAYIAPNYTKGESLIRLTDRSSIVVRETYEKVKSIVLEGTK